MGRVAVLLEVTLKDVDGPVALKEPAVSEPIESALVLLRALEMRLFAVLVTEPLTVPLPLSVETALLTDVTELDVASGATAVEIRLFAVLVTEPLMVPLPFSFVIAAALLFVDEFRLVIDVVRSAPDNETLLTAREPAVTADDVDVSGA